MNVQKTQISFFSSDFNSDTLIYTDTEGTIVQNGSQFTPDHLKKDIKFYPPDDRVFTTTDITGLRVWDSTKLAILYQYKPDQLSRHAYSSDCVLSAFDDYNIKFYDLRCRYVLKSFPKGRVRDLGWIENQLYVYDGDSVVCYDYRSLSNELCFKNIINFAIGARSCFMIRKQGEDRLLLNLVKGCHSQRLPNVNRTPPGSGPADHQEEPTHGSEVVQKKTKYEKILGIKSCDSIACIENGKIKIEERNRIWEFLIPEKIKSLEAIYFKQGGGYLFMNDNLYEFDGSIVSAL